MKPAVIVTGAGSGIGKAIAEYFGSQGHDVVLVGRKKEKLQATAKNIQTKTLILALDLQESTNNDNVIIEAIKTFPHLGVLVNNAGIYEYKPFQNSTNTDWNDLIKTNLLSPVQLTRAILPHFKKAKSGVVINIASTAGLRPLEGAIAYSTTKAALIHLTQSLALEHAKDQIKFHAVCPGVVETPILSKDTVKKMGPMHPLGAVGQPEDIARSVYFLACEGTWMTGVVLPVDGGISLK